jgi:hypothetical protein
MFGLASGALAKEGVHDSILFNPFTLLGVVLLLSIMSYQGIYAVVLTTNKSGFNPKTEITMGVKTP